MKTIQIFTKEVPSDEPAGHFSAFLKVGGALPYLVLDTDAVPQNLEVALTTVNLLYRNMMTYRESSHKSSAYQQSAQAASTLFGNPPGET